MATRDNPCLPGYEVLERIGRGAGAIISLARDGAGGQLVAIKHIVRQSPEDDRFIAQAENEYEVARQVNDPRLRRCLDLVRLRRWFKTRELFLVMEYVDGEPLEDQRPDSMERVTEIFKGVAQGLHALHQLGYAHADIKPNNILLTRDGGLKIIDFGQSCPLGHTKERVQGTPDYMAPEQVHRRAIDQRTDVFNLGASMYWVVTGKWFRTLMPSVPAASPKIHLEMARNQDPPHVLNPRVPLPLSKLIVECCQSAKEDRPRDMREVLSRLEVVDLLLERGRAGPPRPRGR